MQNTCAFGDTTSGMAFKMALVHRSQTYCHNPLLKPPLCHFKMIFSPVEPCDVGSQQGIIFKQRLKWPEEPNQCWKGE